MIPRSSFYKKKMCDTAVPHLSGIRSAGIGPPRRRGYGAIGAKHGTDRPRHIKPLHHSRFPVYKDTK